MAVIVYTRFATGSNFIFVDVLLIITRSYRCLNTCLKHAQGRMVLAKAVE